MTCKFHHPELIGGSGMLLPAAAHAATMLAATQGNKGSVGNAPLVLSATNNPLVLAAAQQRQLTGYLVSGPAGLPAGVHTGGTNYVVLAGPEYAGVQQVGLDLLTHPHAAFADSCTTALTSATWHAIGSS
jgi:hypothetical protein